jgi:hypothetical protein
MAISWPGSATATRTRMKTTTTAATAAKTTTGITTTAAKTMTGITTAGTTTKATCGITTAAAKTTTGKIKTVGNDDSGDDDDELDEDSEMPCSWRIPLATPTRCQPRTSSPSGILSLLQGMWAHLYRSRQGKWGGTSRERATMKVVARFRFSYFSCTTIDDSGALFPCQPMFERHEEAASPILTGQMTRGNERPTTDMK